MNYYNDIDEKVCAWTQELIDAGVIPDGKVDCRSIKEVTPDDVKGFTQCHFFCGISGWAYALRLAGWPDNRPVWTASLPCQPFSSAGKGLAERDERHLWPTFRRLLAFCGPATLFGEQVASNAGREWFAGVRADLEALGYVCGGADLCAAGIGAPHIRQRLFWCANADSAGQRTGRRKGLHTEGESWSFTTHSDDSFWSDSIWWPCRDGKLRRVPAGRVRHPERHGRGEHQQGPRPEERTASCGAGESMRLGNLDDNGRDQRRQCQPTPGNDGTERTGAACGLSDAELRGREAGQLDRQGVHRCHPERQDAPDHIPTPQKHSADEQPCRLSDSNGRRCEQRDQRERSISELDTDSITASPQHAGLETEPALLVMVDGVPADLVQVRMPDGWEVDWEAFPLAETCPGRTAILKGAGNAIVPALAAEFIKAATG